MITFGGSGITKNCYDWIESNLQEGKTILEIGAGNTSTTLFSKKWKTYSVEDNEQYVNLVDNVKYIHAPIKNGWYDVERLKEEIPSTIDLLFIDGPYNQQRSLILDHISIFNLKNATIIIDDTYRKDCQKIVDFFVNSMGKKIVMRGTDESTNEHQFTVLS